MTQKTPDDWSYSESLVTFGLTEGYRMVDIYIEEKIVDDSIHVYDFAKVIEEHDRLSALDESSKKYQDLYNLWLPLSEELSSHYQREIHRVERVEFLKKMKETCTEIQSLRDLITSYHNEVASWEIRYGLGFNRIFWGIESTGITDPYAYADSCE